MLGNDFGLEPGQLLADILAALATIDHADLVTGEALLELGLEPARIIQGRGAGADALGRGGADRNDGQRLVLLHAGRRMRLRPGRRRI